MYPYKFLCAVVSNEKHAYPSKGKDNMQAINNELRSTEAYQFALQSALQAYPNLTPDLFDMALCAALGDPQGHLKVKLIDDESKAPVSDAVVRVHDAVTITEEDTNVTSTDLTQISKGDA